MHTYLLQTDFLSDCQEKINRRISLDPLRDCAIQCDAYDLLRIEQKRRNSPHHYQLIRHCYRDHLPLPLHCLCSKENKGTFFLLSDGFVLFFLDIPYILKFLNYILTWALLQVSTIKLVVLLNIVSYVMIVAVTYFFIQPPKRVHILGGINLLLSFIVFVAPLSIIVSICT